MSNLKDEKYSHLNPGYCDLNKLTSEPFQVDTISGATVISQDANDLMAEILVHANSQ